MIPLDRTNSGSHLCIDDEGTTVSCRLGSAGNGNVKGASPTLRNILLAASTSLLMVALAILYFVHQDAQLHLHARLESLAMHSAQASAGLREVPRDPGDTYERYRGLFHLRAFRKESAALAVWAKVDFDSIGRVGSAPDLVFGDFSEETYAALSDTLSQSERWLLALATRRSYVSRADVRDLLQRVDLAIKDAESPQEP